MAKLSSDLFERCVEIFHKCDEFNTDEDLKSIFVTKELIIYKQGLNDAQSIKSRVNLTIDYLNKLYLKDRRPVLTIFIEQLCKKYDEQDSRHDELKRLHTDFQNNWYNPEAVEVPFVIMAMTQADIRKTHEETFFTNPEFAQCEKERFETLNQTLINDKSKDWKNHYYNSRDLWRPFVDEDVPIIRIIQVIEKIINDERYDNDERHDNQLNPIRCFSLSDSFFHKDDYEQSRAKEQLRQLGGFFIIDAVSLFHPGLRHILIQSGLTDNEDIAIIVLSPFNSIKQPMNNMIEGLLRTNVNPIFSRCDERLDRFCEIGDGNLRFLKRWLIARLPQTADIVEQRVFNINRIDFCKRVPRQTQNVQDVMFR